MRIYDFETYINEFWSFRKNKHSNLTDIDNQKRDEQKTISKSNPFSNEIIKFHNDFDIRQVLSQILDEYSFKIENIDEYNKQKDSHKKYMNKSIFLTNNKNIVISFLNYDYAKGTILEKFEIDEDDYEKICNLICQYLDTFYIYNPKSYGYTKYYTFLLANNHNIETLFKQKDITSKKEKENFKDSFYKQFKELFPKCKCEIFLTGTDDDVNESEIFTYINYDTIMKMTRIGDFLKQLFKYNTSKQTKIHN